MGKRIQILICVGIMTSLLAACVESSENDRGMHAVSGSVISGQAVAGTGKEGNYHFCNKYCLYYSERNTAIIEHRLSDGAERKIEVKYLEGVCFVDDEWVYYVKDGVDLQGELYRAPIETEKLNIEKSELIFIEPFGIEDDQVYCDGRYLVYTTGESSDSYYRKYDLKEHKYVGEQKKEDDAATLYGVAGRAAIYSGYDGVMRQGLDSEELIKITDYYFGSTNEHDGQIAMTDSDVFYAEDDVFDEESTDEETYQRQQMDEDDAPPIEIGQYHMADNSNKKIITYDQMRRLLIQEGFIDTAQEKKYEYYPERLFVSDERLYVQMDISWTENKVIHQNKAVFSYKIGSKEKLRYEEGLTGCLANTKKDQKVFEKIYDDEENEGEDALFLSRGGCLYMAEGKCFMYLYDPEQDENRVACYELASGRFRFLTKNDPDWYLPYYNGALPYWKAFAVEIEEDMPNNKLVDWPYW